MRPWPRVWCGGPAQPVGAPALVLEFECATKSEANERRFGVSTGRKRKQDAALGDELVGRTLPSGPWCVRFTRVAAGVLDDDNLGSAFKRLRDRMAQALGVNDRDPVVAWVVAQEKRKGDPAVRVEVWGGTASPTRASSADDVLLGGGA